MLDCWLRWFREFEIVWDLIRNNYVIVIMYFVKWRSTSLMNFLKCKIMHFKYISSWIELQCIFRCCVKNVFCYPSYTRRIHCVFSATSMLGTDVGDAIRRWQLWDAGYAIKYIKKITNIMKKHIDSVTNILNLSPSSM